MVELMCSHAEKTFRNSFRLLFLWVLCILTLGSVLLGSNAYAQEVSWSGAGDGTSWEDPANWNPTSVPGLDADVTINADLGGAYTIVISSETTINSLVLSNFEATLDLQANLTLTTTLNQTFGRLSGIGDLNINGEYSWRGGRMEGSGTTFLNGGADITGGAGSSGNNKVIDARRLVVPNGQIFSFNGSLFTGQNGAVIEIQEGGLFDLVTNSSNSVMRVGEGGATILNAGTISKSQGTTFQINIEWGLENSGLLSISQQDASLQWQGALTDNGGQYIVEQGFLDLDLPASVDPYIFTPASRLLAGPGARINLGSGFGGEASLTEYILQGSVEMDGIFSIKNFNGSTTASVTIPATANLVNLGQELLLVGTSRGRLFVEITDPVSVGDLTIGSIGRLELSSPLTVSGDYTQNNSSAVMVSDFDIMVEGGLAWSGGRMEGSGTTFLNGGAVITGGPGSASSNKTLNQRRLVIPTGQSMEISGNRLTGSNGAILDIREGGLLDITAGNNSRVMEVGDGGATILNAGTISKSQGTTFQIDVYWSLENLGTLEITQDEAELQFYDQFSNTGTISILSETAILESDEPIINDGDVLGVGIIRGTLENRTGTIRPGLNFDTTGLLTIQGAFIQSETGTMVIKIGGTVPGTEFDRLVTSSSNINGTLEVTRLNDYTFAETDEIQPLTWNSGSQTGTFANFVNEEFPDSDFSLEYSSDGLIIKEQTLAVPGIVQLTSPEDGATGVSINPQLVWEPVADAGTYQVQVSTEEGLTNPVIDQSGIGETKLQVESLNYETLYYWRVRAVNEVGTGEWSSTWIFTTEGEPLTAPGVVTLSSPEDGSTGISINPQLVWEAATDAGTYQVQVSTEEGLTNPVIDQSGIGETQLQVESLNYETLYYWRVRAVNEVGTGEWSSTWIFTTEGEPLTAPGVVTLSSPEDGSTGISINPELVWESVADAGTYQVQVSTE